MSVTDYKENPWPENLTGGRICMRPMIVSTHAQVGSASGVVDRARQGHAARATLLPVLRRRMVKAGLSQGAVYNVLSYLSVFAPTLPPACMPYLCSSIACMRFFPFFFLFTTTTTTTTTHSSLQLPIPKERVIYLLAQGGPW
jgi:hypothetical protein